MKSYPTYTIAPLGLPLSLGVSLMRSTDEALAPLPPLTPGPNGTTIRAPKKPVLYTSTARAVPGGVGEGIIFGPVCIGTFISDDPDQTQEQEQTPYTIALDEGYTLSALRIRDGTYDATVGRTGAWGARTAVGVPLGEAWGGLCVSAADA